MSARYDRRTFLRCLARSGVAAPIASLLGCGRGDDPAPEPSDALTRAAAPSISRPVLLPWSGEGVRIAAPLAEAPIAYVSMGRRQVFVDYAFRDRSHWILDAHISVSTGLWRIPLPGDPPGQPIAPGDTEREFEELDIAEWDATLEPAEGDFRILLGRPRDVLVDFSCVPMWASGGWYSGGPWRLRRCDGVGADACREDFVEIGVGTRQPVRGCADPTTPVRFLTWVARSDG